MTDPESYEALLQYWSRSTVRKNRPVSERHLAQLAKRGFDVISASAILILTLPFMLVAAAAIALDGGPIFYLGNRIGAKEGAFKFFKFRTMLPDADLCLEEYLEHHPSARREWLQDRKLAFDPRVTPVGRILRRLNLDELPQLISVIRGEMSLVGPRIVAVSELENCASCTDLDKSMRPGITGLWKVNGCNDLSAQVALDDHYVRNWSIILDLWILVHSLRVASTKMFAR